MKASGHGHMLGLGFPFTSEDRESSSKFKGRQEIGGYLLLGKGQLLF